MRWKLAASGHDAAPGAARLQGRAPRRTAVRQRTRAALAAGGAAEAAEGDHAAARERWRRAEEVALRKGTRLSSARARYEIARHSDAATAERQAYLADAAVTFERLGALQMLRRVREGRHGPTAEVKR